MGRGGEGVGWVAVYGATCDEISGCSVIVGCEGEGGLRVRKQWRDVR